MFTISVTNFEDLIYKTISKAYFRQFLDFLSLNALDPDKKKPQSKNRRKNKSLLLKASTSKSGSFHKNMSFNHMK